MSTQTFALRQTAPLGSLTVAYSQLHTGAVDVAGLELCGLRNSQPAAIDRHQKRPIARLSGRSQDCFDLTARVDLRAPCVALHVRHRRHQVKRLSPECYGVEKAHGVDGDVDAG